MSEGAPFDVDKYLGADQDDLPEITPNRVTYYYPETPENTRKAGLSYKMEGGIQGGAGFSDLDLRNHTLEKYDAGESDFVAVAMPGKPTGEKFRFNLDGKTKVGKWVDTGGGLRGGQADIATSNPDLARGGGYGVAGGGEGGVAPAPSSFDPSQPLTLGREPEKEPEKQARAPRGRAPSGYTVPKIEVSPRIEEPFEIPWDAGPASEPIALSDFSSAVQEAALRPPPASLVAGNMTQAAAQQAEQEPAPFDVDAYLAGRSPTPTQTPTPAETPTFRAPATSTAEAAPFDVDEYLGEGPPQPVPSAVPPPTDRAIAEPGTFSAGAVRAAEEMVPRSAGDVGWMAGESLTPVVGGLRDIARTGKKLYDVATGTPLSEAFPAEKPFTEYNAEDWGHFTTATGIQAAGAIPAAGGVAGAIKLGRVRGEPQPSVAATNAALRRLESEGGKSASLMHTPKTIFNRVFGNGIGDRVSFAENHAQALMGRNVADLRKAGFTKLDKFELENLRNVAEGTDVPMNDRVKEVAEVWDKIRKEDAADYVAKGAKVQETPKIRDEDTGLIIRKSVFRDFVPRDNYAPNYVDLNKVANAPGTFADDIAKLNPGLTQTQASEIANYLRADARGEGGLHLTDPDLLQLVRGSSRVPTHLHARGTLELPRYVYESMRESIPKYLAESSKERGFLEAFGPEFDLTIQDLVTQLGPRRTNVKLAEEKWDEFRGRKLESESGVRIRQTANTLNNLATASLLGIPTAVSQISQLGPIVAKLGLRRTAVGMIKAFTRDGRLQAQKAGSFVNALIDDYAVVTKTTPTAGKLKKAEKATAYLASKVVKFAGIEKMDHFPRVVAFHAAESEIKAAMRRAASGNKRAIRELAKEGLSATSTDSQIAEAAASISKKYNLNTRWSDLPAFLQTPTGSFARGLNTFNVQMSRLLWKEFLKPAMHGRVGPLLKLLTAQVFTGEVIGETRRWLTGRTGDRPGGSLPEFLDDVIHGRKTSMEIAGRALDDLSWSGTLGFAQNIYQALAWATSGTESGARLLTSISGAGISNALETVTGAGYELGMAGGAAIRSQMGVRKEREEARQEMERRLQTGGRILTRRIPVVGGIVAPRVFRSEQADQRMAASAIKRAKKRGDPYASMRWRAWFKSRHPKSWISRSAVENAAD